MKGILCWRWSLTPSPLERNHHSAGLPSADIAAFNLSEEEQLFLKVGRGTERQISEDWTVVFEHKRRDASVRAVAGGWFDFDGLVFIITLWFWSLRGFEHVT